MDIYSDLEVTPTTWRGRLMAWAQRPNVKATMWTLAIFAYGVGLDAALDTIRL